MELTPVSIAFTIMSILALGGGFGVVVNRNLIHAALFLVLSLFGVAGLFILLEAPFLAAIQILVYVGAITVLITITVMVTRRIMGIHESVNRQWPLAALVGVLTMVTLGFVVWTRFENLTPVADVPPDSVAMLGTQFTGAFLLPFEVASVLLLAALIGSIVVARD
jgi:NADH:ubiquinone oxidoreductase subunit 6 (subunit J)